MVQTPLVDTIYFVRPKHWANPHLFSDSQENQHLLLLLPEQIEEKFRRGNLNGMFLFLEADSLHEHQRVGRHKSL